MVLFQIIMIFLITLNSIYDCRINDDHKEALIKTIKNAEKEAKMQERLLFLIECRKEGIIPKFITDGIRTVGKIFRQSVSLETKQQTFCRQLLNEAISETHRTLAYLHREYHRLSHKRREYTHPVTGWTEEQAIHIYEETTMACRQRLTKKFRGLMAERDKQHEQRYPADLDRVKNMTDKPISESLQALLAKGPTFALTQQAGKTVTRDAEIGIERAYHALRWKLHIERTNDTRREQAQRPHEAQRPPEGGEEHTSVIVQQAEGTEGNRGQGGPGTDLGQQRSLRKPQFPNVPTKQATPVDRDTEHSMGTLKHRIMAIYRNAPRTVPNTPAEARAGLNELKRDANIVVKPSDKCKGLVLMTRDDYVAKGEDITNAYEQIEQNPMAKTEAQTKRIISETIKNKIHKSTVAAIRPHHSRCAELYGLPKTHKEGEPLRPIVSGIDDPIDRLGWLLEQITAQLLKYVPAHLKDTGDFLDRLRAQYPGGFPAGSIAFSMDVKNLYGNVPTTEGIEAVMELIRDHHEDLNLFGLAPDDVEALLAHCLQNNYFRFNSKFYKQSTGIAMGSRIAPSLAIVFMGKFEAMARQADRPQPDMYVRYIDDIWGLWTHGSESLTEYLEFLNSRHASIQLTIERSDIAGGIPYLDTWIDVKDDGSYSTELFIKPMAAAIILPYDSAHAMQTKRAVLTSQTVRAIRIGSNTAARNRGLEKIRGLFIQNGYPKAMVEKHIKTEQRKYEEDRDRRGEQRPEEQRKEQRKENRKKGAYIRLPFISDRVASQVKRAVRNSGLPVQIAWTNNKTLKRQLVRSRLTPLPCSSGRKRCYSCHAGLKDRCGSKNVVYELTCDHCGEKYIGETSRPIRLRYNEHRRNCLNGEPDTPFGNHATLRHPDLSHDNFAVSAKILRFCKDEADRRISESMYIRDERPKINDNTTSWQLLPQ